MEFKWCMVCWNTWQSLLMWKQSTVAYSSHSIIQTYIHTHTHNTPNSAVHSSVSSCFPSVWTLLTAALQNTTIWALAGETQTLIIHWEWNAQQTHTHTHTHTRMHCSVAAWAHHKAPPLCSLQPIPVLSEPSPLRLSLTPQLYEPRPFS